ncbi:MAG: hypothetical protein RL458_3547 [Pseudomonadota bacterium]|jgi:hypothetical protein
MDRQGIFVAVALLLAVQISIAIWWIPQKWAACGRLYDNRPARVVCVLGNS